MRADGIDEQQLKLNVPFDEVDSGFVSIAVEKIEILESKKFMEAILDHVSVNHFFVSFTYLADLSFHLVFENRIKKSHFRLSSGNSVSFSVFQRLCKEHLKCRKLHDGCISIFFCKVGVVDRIASLSTSHSCSISTVLLDSLF